jgi:anti-sigma factor RsiW
MTMHEEWTDQLSEYLDGELGAEAAAAVEAHLRGCPDCTGVLNDLKRVVAQARTLQPRLPDTELWDGIRNRRPAQRARFTFTLPQLAAAAAVLMALSALSGGLGWQIGQRAGRSVAPAPAAGATLAAAPAAAENEAPNDGAAVPVGLSDVQYDAAVVDLEKALKSGRGRLDASTIAIVERNLQIIDQAIAQARDALSADPANGYLSSHLVEARRRKLDLLRRAAALTETN